MDSILCSVILFTLISLNADSGVVFNEMKGVYSQPDNVLGRTAQQVCLSLGLLPLMTLFSTIVIINVKDVSNDF